VSQIASQPEAQDQSAAPQQSRFVMALSTLAARDTYQLDTATGKVWRIMTVKGERPGFSLIPVEEGDTQPTPGSAGRYKLYLSTITARDTFLVDTESGAAWEMVTDKNERCLWESRDKVD